MATECCTRRIKTRTKSYELFSVPTAGGIAAKLNGELVNGGDVLDDAVFSPDGGRVLYRADQDVDDVVELFSVAQCRRRFDSAKRRLGHWRQRGNVRRSVPTARHVAYLADQDVDDVFELYSCPAAVAWLAENQRDDGAGGRRHRLAVQSRRADRSCIAPTRTSTRNSSSLPLLSATILPGDFNGSGVVDAADYAVWRNGLATNAYSPGQYGVWKANFGRRLGDGAAAMSAIPRAIPEPTASCYGYRRRLLSQSSAVGSPRSLIEPILLRQPRRHVLLGDVADVFGDQRFDFQLEAVLEHLLDFLLPRASCANQG